MLSTIGAVAGTFTRTLRRQRRALCAVLIEARNEAGLSQVQLATTLRIPRTTVSRVETGERRLDVLEFILWAQAIGLSPDLLWKRVRKRAKEIDRGHE